MPRLPDFVDIGPLVYLVTEDRAAYSVEAVADGNAAWGMIKYGLGKILINPDQSVSHKRMALLHEVLHGCWHMTDRDHNGDEDPMLRLAGPLLDTLRRNPEFVGYLLAD